MRKFKQAKTCDSMRDQLLFTSNDESEAYKTDKDHAFLPKWASPWISRLAAEHVKRCSEHLGITVKTDCVVDTLSA